MPKGKKVLTTGQVARICNVASRTVSKWFDNGHLKGYRIPGSGDRRIPASELARFMKAHNMPTKSTTAGKLRVLIVESNEEVLSALCHGLSEKTDYQIATAKSDFETGTIAQKFAPHVLLIDLLSKDINARNICRSIRADSELETIKIIAIANDLSASEAEALLQKGFDGYVANAGDIDEIVKRIEETTAIVY
ncbi:MAG: helix-turn-helix domain-containing protein [Planctomycetota bacterium]